MMSLTLFTLSCFCLEFSIWQLDGVSLQESVVEERDREASNMLGVLSAAGYQVSDKNHLYYSHL